MQAAWHLARRHAPHSPGHNRGSLGLALKAGTPATPAADRPTAAARQRHQQAQLLASRHPPRGAAPAAACHSHTCVPPSLPAVDSRKRARLLASRTVQLWATPAPYVAAHLAPSPLHLPSPRQVDVIQRLEHPCLVKLHEWYVHDGKLYLIMDLLAGGRVATRPGGLRG